MCIRKALAQVECDTLGIMGRILLALVKNCLSESISDNLASVLLWSIGTVSQLSPVKPALNHAPVGTNVASKFSLRDALLMQLSQQCALCGCQSGVGVIVHNRFI